MLAGQVKTGHVFCHEFSFKLTNMKLYGIQVDVSQEGRVWQTLHYAKVVMGRQTFKYTAIQRKISLSLSNLLSFASKFLCKSRKMRRRKNFRL